MQRWTVLLPLVMLGCSAGTTRASETPAALEPTTEVEPNVEGSEQDDPCTAPAVEGDCDGWFQGVYFHRSSGRCVAEGVSGCSATFPFSTLEECRARCETRADPAGK